MADKIRLLPDMVANQIAAGEVVLQPSSVVKEMMENSIAAGAGCVTVNFRDGGKELIQIVDDGCGMSPIDARMAFDRHATSKIHSADDLYALRTFGFRGEALASIAAVSQVELRTRQAVFECGTVTVLSGGECIDQKPVQCPVVSNFKITNLFYNLPARRKFLRRSALEGRSITREFCKIALCNPQVAFKLYDNDAITYDLAPCTPVQRIVGVVGKRMSGNLLEVNASTSIVQVTGYVGKPSCAKRTNSEQYLFVNGRYFKSDYFRKAILSAYEKLIPAGEQPSFFIYLTIEPDRIDVNVHPQKTEVKFTDGVAVWQILNAAVRESLAKLGAVPMMDFDAQEGGADIPVFRREQKTYKVPESRTNFNYNPFRDYNEDGSRRSSADLSDFVGTYDASDDPSRGARGGFIGPDGEVSPEGFFGRVEAETDVVSEAFASGAETSSVEYVSGEEAVQSRIDSFDAQSGGAAFTHAALLSGGYASAVLGGRLCVVDLRRARECILYDRYAAMLRSGSSVCQQLLFPDRMVLSTEEFGLLREHDGDFASLGFDIRYGSDGEIELTGIPADLDSESTDRLIYRMLECIRDDTHSPDELRREKLAAVMARAGAAGALPDTEEAVSLLLGQLAESASPRFTPSGLEVIWEIGPEEIRRRLR